jgi:hypothetical protein
MIGKTVDEFKNVSSPQSTLSSASKVFIFFQHSLLNFILTQRLFSRNPERLRKSPWISTLVNSLYRLYIVQQLILSFLEAPAESVVRVLPYSSVPGMLTSSHSYFKAVATLAKQQNQLDPSRGAGSDLANASSSKGKKKTKPGEPFSFI